MKTVQEQFAIAEAAGRVYELIPNDGRKSFYGKAKVADYLNRQILKSYNTIVAVIDAGGQLHRLWGDWSATTGRHLAAFSTQYHGKAALDKMPVETFTR